MNNTFVIIFRQVRPLTDVELAGRQHEIAAWADVANSAGRALEPRMLGPEFARPGGDGLEGDSSAPVSALLFLNAHDLDDAAAVAASHPGVRYGAALEVRPWNAPAARR